jgi:hypothetical protein
MGEAEAVIPLLPFRFIPNDYFDHDFSRMLFSPLHIFPCPNSKDHGTFISLPVAF